MRVLALLAAALLVGGCTTTVLLPAEEATTVGPGHAATEQVEGVRVHASALAWSGRPLELRHYLTPILVTVDNESEHRLLVRLEQFELVGPGKVRLAAFGPYQVRGTVTERTGYGADPYGELGYGWGPGYRYPYLGFGGYYYDWYPTYVRYPLPTADMVYMALEEGVLEPGERRTGFVYFPQVEELPAVTFVARLVDADTGETFGVLDIPFVKARVPVR